MELTMSAEWRRLPPLGMGGDIETPEVDGVAAQPKVLAGIICRTGLDDHRGAVLARAEVLTAVLVQKLGDLGGVMHFGGGCWHGVDAQRGERRADSASGPCARSSGTDAARAGSSGR